LDSRPPPHFAAVLPISPSLPFVIPEGNTLFVIPEGNLRLPLPLLLQFSSI